MRRIGLLLMSLTVATACSRPPSEERLASGVGVGSGGAAANVKGDGDFVHDVATITMAQIELSRMAIQKATSANLRFFAQRIIDEHGAASTNLKSIALDGWPTEVGDKHREIADKLATKQGADFDQEYIEAIIEGHQDLTARLESRLDVGSLAEWKTAVAGRAQSGALPDPNAEMRDLQLRPNASDNELTKKVNQWAAETYPIAQKHLDSARTLDNATKKPATN